MSDGSEGVNRLDNPWFSETWYRSTYPDIATDEIDARCHYEEIGWREGRDPSGLFSTSWYLERYPDVAASASNPLSHYVQHGRRESRRPHPGLDNVDHGLRRVAIIVVSFNAPGVLRLLLDSLVVGHNDTPYAVFLIENGSEPEVKAEIRQQVAEYSASLTIIFIDLDKNHGFSGGNNIGISAALKDNFTHICLLNSDVVCTPGWIDDLVEAGAPVISPVSNAVGNEQTVVVDYDCAVSDAIFADASRFAAKRLATFGKSLVRSDFLGFFCVMFEVSVVRKVGLLDEQFFPGSYEDDDYCLRLMEAGFELLIARHVFLHHFGSASFSTLAWNDRVAVGDSNRDRFETKWRREWSDRMHLPAWSGVQDADSYAARDDREAMLADTLRRHATAHARHIRDLVAAIVQYRKEIAKRDQRILQLTGGLPGSALETSFALLSRVAWGQKPISIDRHAHHSFLTIYRAMIAIAWKVLEDRDSASFGTLTNIQPFAATLATLFQGERPVVFLTQVTDPVTSDEKDGYVQRVRAIDALCVGRPRLYVHVDEGHRSNPTLTQLVADIWRLEMADRDPVGEAILACMLKQDVNIYAHSIFGLQARTIRSLVRERRGLLLLDVHGSVPEEFELYGDGFSAQIFDEYEREMATEIDWFIAVSHNMAKYLEAKHEIDKDRFLVCPIFVQIGERGVRRSYLDRPRVVYAGGTQKWQQIEKMAALAIADAGRSDFYIFTPDVNKMSTVFGEVLAEPSVYTVTIASAGHAEVLASYQKHDFGLLLREDCTVNRVSCPTKLIEYLTFGVIPILESPHVGDFADLGMAYVRIKDYANGRIPSPAERKVMAAANFRLLDKLRAQMEDGSEKIRRLLIGYDTEVEAA